MRAEITWSIMHPTKPDVAYMREVVAQSEGYRVDSFELCGDAHASTGGLDGAIRFRDYPAASARLDLSEIESNIQALREIVDLAHRSGRPIYYWHREVMIPREVMEAVPGLLDEAGEFNLLGEPYQNLVRSKLREFFDNVPQMDGLVVTLTEADYSVIHNSNAKRYPPRVVVRQVITTFAEELARLGKRFILRSFGSIAQDYEDILAGAREVGPKLPFEIETKITPYDFSPFLELNPFLTKTGTATLSAEYDSIGEFQGAGYLPGPDPQRIIQCVNYATSRKVDRHTIRVDRINHATFFSPQAIHLLAYDRAISDPGVSAEAIWKEWAAAHWPYCPEEMAALMRTGIEMAKQTHFIDGHVIFHAFPVHPEMRWIKACGILSLFTPGVSLERHRGMWGIRSDRTTPPRGAILREKEAAIQIADDGWKNLLRLRDRLSPAEFRLAEKAWGNATVVTRLIRSWCRCVEAYFQDLNGDRPEHPALSAAIEAGRPDFAPFLIPLPGMASIPVAPAEPKVHRHEYGNLEPITEGIDQAYARPIWRLVGLLLEEYEGELAERAEWRSLPGLVDFVVCGGLIDDFRVYRYMHGSHARLIDGRPARAAGHRAFPNGFFECHLSVPKNGRFRLVIRGDPNESEGFLLTVNGWSQEVRYASGGRYECLLSAFPDAIGSEGKLRVRIQKSGTQYPWVYGMATVENST